MLKAHRVALSTGGLDGILNPNLIQSAIARPYSGHHRSISRKAAALSESLVKNHGFVDGNKRTALLSLFVLLDRSGYETVAPDRILLAQQLVSEEEAEILGETDNEQMILAVAEGLLSYEDLIKWFRVRMRRKV